MVVHLSVTQAALAHIVQSGDPQEIELAARLLAADPGNLIDLHQSALRVIEKETAAFQERLASDRLVLNLTERILAYRIEQAGAKALPHADYDVHLDFNKTVSKRIDVLRELEGLVPEQELQPALYLSNPKPEWKADAAKLRALARKYGGKIAEIVKAGCVDELSRPRLVITPREKTKLVP